MTKLICSAVNCLNNIDGLCTARVIHIEGKDINSGNKSYCKTFSDRTLRSTLAGMVNMNIIGEVRQVFKKNSIVMSPKVTCEIHKCGYNFRGECIALNVQIYGTNCYSKQCTECETFIKGNF